MAEKLEVPKLNLDTLQLIKNLVIDVFPEVQKEAKQDKAEINQKQEDFLANTNNALNENPSDSELQGVLASVIDQITKEVQKKYELEDAPKTQVDQEEIEEKEATKMPSDEIQKEQKTDIKESEIREMAKQMLKTKLSTPAHNLKSIDIDIDIKK